MTIKLLTTDDEYRQLAHFSEGRGVNVLVPRSLISHITIDHSRMVDRLNQLREIESEQT